MYLERTYIVPSVKPKNAPPIVECKSWGGRVVVSVVFIVVRFARDPIDSNGPY